MNKSVQEELNVVTLKIRQSYFKITQVELKAK